MLIETFSYNTIVRKLSDYFDFSNSVFDATTVFQSDLNETISRLTDVWDKCGMTDEVGLIFVEI